MLEYKLESIYPQHIDRLFAIMNSQYYIRSGVWYKDKMEHTIKSQDREEDFSQKPRKSYVMD